MMDVWWLLKRRYFVQFPRFCAGYDLPVGAHDLRGSCDKELNNQVPVVRKVDNAIHRINHYPVDSVVCFVKT